MSLKKHLSTIYDLFFSVLCVEERRISRISVQNYKGYMTSRLGTEVTQIRFHTNSTHNNYYPYNIIFRINDVRTTHPCVR